MLRSKSHRFGNTLHCIHVLCRYPINRLYRYHIRFPVPLLGTYIRLRCHRIRQRRLAHAKLPTYDSTMVSMSITIVRLRSDRIDHIYHRSAQHGFDLPFAIIAICLDDRLPPPPPGNFTVNASSSLDSVSEHVIMTY